MVSYDSGSQITQLTPCSSQGSKVSAWVQVEGVVDGHTPFTVTRTRALRSGRLSFTLNGKDLTCQSNRDTQVRGFITRVITQCCYVCFMATGSDRTRAGVQQRTAASHLLRGPTLHWPCHTHGQPIERPAGVHPPSRCMLDASTPCTSPMR